MTGDNRAAILPTKDSRLDVVAVETPTPGPGEILVRNHAVAIQPLDAKMLLKGYDGAGAQTYPVVLGSSGAGTIEAVGEYVADLTVGDRVVFDTRAYVDTHVNRREGAWQKLVIAAASTVTKIGDATFEQAVLIDFPLQTAVAALHLFLGMAAPGGGSKEERVLVWGAGGAVGSYAVQYAKSVGHTVVVTASSRDSERQKRLGASEVIDYKAADAVDRLRQLGPYSYLFTASGDVPSQQALAALLQPKGGRFASVLGGAVDLPSNVERVYTAFSQAAQRAKYSTWRAWWYGEYLPTVLQEGLVEPAQFSKVAGGLAALHPASTEVFEGRTRGKLIVNPQE